MSEEKIIMNGKVQSVEEVEAQLKSKDVETKGDACDAVQYAQAAVDESLEANGISFDNTFSAQRWNTAESETDAAVEAEMVQHVSCDTKPEETIISGGQDISIEQIEEELPADVPQTVTEAKEGLEVAEEAADETLRANGISLDDTNPWQRENADDSETIASVDLEVAEHEKKANKDLPVHLL